MCSIIGLIVNPVRCTKKNKKPPFEITNPMIDYVAEIVELRGPIGCFLSVRQFNAAAQQPYPHHLWVAGYRAERPFSGTGDRRSERQAYASSTQGYCRSQKCLRNLRAAVRELCGVSSTTANRILTQGVADEKLEKHCVSGHWSYRIKSTTC